MTIARSLRAVGTLVAAGLVITACGGSSSNPTSSAPAPTSSSAPAPTSSGGGRTEVIRVGMVSLQSGALAASGAADAWVVAAMTSWFTAHPIQVDGTFYTVETIVKDAESDPTRARAVASELISSDGVDFVMAHGPADIVNSIADVCEATMTPCLTAEGTWQNYYFGRQRDPYNPRPFAYTFHIGWGLEDIVSVYQDMWSQVPTNQQVGGLFTTDIDGRLWSANLPDLLTDQGFVVDAPATYEPAVGDFTAQVASFKAADDQIMVGMLNAADLQSFWAEAQRQGYNPPIASAAFTADLPSSIAFLGASAENLNSEVWWSPSAPFTSSLTGRSAMELTTAWTNETGKQWTQSMGFVEALYEVLNAAVVAAGGPDKQATSKAMPTLKVSTIVGDLDWSAGPVPNVATTPLSGGQWRMTEGGQFPWELVIVANPQNPDQPLGGTMEPRP